MPVSTVIAWTLKIRDGAEPTYVLHCPHDAPIWWFLEQERQNALPRTSQDFEDLLGDAAPVCPHCSEIYYTQQAEKGAA